MTSTQIKTHTLKDDIIIDEELATQFIEANEYNRRKFLLKFIDDLETEINYKGSNEEREELISELTTKILLQKLIHIHSKNKK